MKSNGNAVASGFIVAVILCLALAGCSPKPPPAPQKTPTRTPIPLARLSLVPGEFYFRLKDQPRFVFSRNLGASDESAYGSFLDWSVAGGSLIVRLPLDCFGVGIAPGGGIDESWASEWERVFDKAAADGLYIVPILTGWVQWDPSLPYSSWPANPLNAYDGGPVEDPLDLFRAGTEAQELWLGWMESVVERWRGRTNILAWEIFSEVNCGTALEADGIDFINTAASRIRAVDPGRLITASRCESGSWSNFYAQADIDFVQVHPYPATGQLDRNIILLVRQVLSAYHRPVMIGESGLHYVRPDYEEGKMTVAENARRGVRHAIWAGIVSGAMNGRALWWEDSFGTYFPELGMPWLEQYSTMEIPAASFVRGVDFTGFAPINASSSPAVWGAAVGNESMVLGWYRDAASEPPDWNVQTIPAGKTVTLTVPGTAANWQVNFYDTTDGITVLSSAQVTRQGGTVIVTLPEFQDDIAFKMNAGAESSVVTPEAAGSTNDIAGTWSGTISNSAGTFSTRLELSIQADCLPGRVCGTFAAPQLPCSGELFLQEINGETYVFIEQNVSGAASCVSGGYEYLQPLPDGTLSYQYTLTPGSTDTSSGVLAQP